MTEHEGTAHHERLARRTEHRDSRPRAAPTNHVAHEREQARHKGADEQPQVGAHEDEQQRDRHGEAHALAGDQLVAGLHAHPANEHHCGRDHPRPAVGMHRSLLVLHQAHERPRRTDGQKHWEDENPAVLCFRHGNEQHEGQRAHHTREERHNRPRGAEVFQQEISLKLGL